MALTNKYEGFCVHCGEIVKAKQGFVEIAKRYGDRQRSRWGVRHLECTRKRRELKDEQHDRTPKASP